MQIYANLCKFMQMDKESETMTGWLMVLKTTTEWYFYVAIKQNISVFMLMIANCRWIGLDLCKWIPANLEVGLRLFGGLTATFNGRMAAVDQSSFPSVLLVTKRWWGLLLTSAVLVRVCRIAARGRVGWQDPLGHCSDDVAVADDAGKSSR